MKFLVVGICSDSFQWAEFQKFEAAEGEMLWQLYGAGILLEALFGEELKCLSFVLECRNSREAEHLIGALPSAKAALVDYKVCGLTDFPGLTGLIVRHNAKLSQ